MRVKVIRIDADGRCTVAPLQLCQLRAALYAAILSRTQAGIAWVYFSKAPSAIRAKMILLQVQPAAITAVAAHIHRTIIAALHAKATFLAALLFRFHARAALLAEMILVGGILRTHAAGATLIYLAAIRAKATILARLLVRLKHTFSAIITNDTMIRAMHSVIRTPLYHFKAFFTLLTVQALLHGAFHAITAPIAEILTILTISAGMAIDHAARLTSVASRTRNAFVRRFRCHFFMTLRADLATFATDFDAIRAASAE
jgi:hypothetical protein